MREARCELGASFVEGRSPECTENKRRDARTWASDRRSLIRERWVRRCLGRAASEGARAISVRGTRDGLSGRPGRYRAAGVFSYEVQGTGCSENQKGAAGAKKFLQEQETGSPDPRGNYRTQNARRTRARRGTERWLRTRRNARVVPSASGRASRRHFHRAIGRAGFQFPCEGWRRD